MRQQELTEAEKKKLAERMKEMEAQNKALGQKSEMETRALEAARAKVQSQKVSRKPQEKTKKVSREGDKDFVGPKYVGMVRRPGGKKYVPEMNRLEKKILSGDATADDKHRYYLVSGQRASDLET